MIIQILTTWIIFIPIAIVNGIIRETRYPKNISDLQAHQISTITASLFFFILTFLIFRNQIDELTLTETLQIGGFWVVLTVFFEFGFGHYIDHAPWKKLMNDYNIFKGRIWPLFLVVELFSLSLLKIL